MNFISLRDIAAAVRRTTCEPGALDALQFARLLSHDHGYDQDLPIGGFISARRTASYGLSKVTHGSFAPCRCSSALDPQFRCVRCSRRLQKAHGRPRASGAPENQQEEKHLLSRRTVTGSF